MSNLIPVHIDKATGKLVAKHIHHPISIATANGFFYQVTVASSVWTIQHNLDTRQLIYQVYDSDYSQVFCDSFKILDENTVELTWGSPQSGYAHIILFGIA